MQKTQHYQLNQWALSDLVRMDDFNADNLAVDNALAGLSAQISGLPSASDIGSIQTALDAALTRLAGLEGGMLQYVPETNPQFVYQQDRYVLNFDGLELEDYALICLTVSIVGGGTQLFHLKPRYVTGASGACLITSYEDHFISGAIALHPKMTTTTVLLFPMGGKSSGTILGTVFFGNSMVGVGTTGTALSNLSGLELVSATGSTQAYDTIRVKLTGIK